ncbi:glycoside hydrolase family 32 protein [Maribacter sp. ACAM166]|nr:glycoside hydrolase family 32 protein [Maribacter sp. ACAM166]TLP82746.1 glycoside hydrolase family 32 protein [Maribacter sp. ACAM166]
MGSYALGHPISEDLVKWEYELIALFSDKNGLILSGSVVVDK